MNSHLYFCLRVPEFPAQATLRLRAEERVLPVAVVEGTPPFEKVCAANAHARRIGVHQGLSRAELDSFAELHVMRRSASEERSARAALHELAASFTPRFEDLSKAHSKKLINCVGMSRDNSLLLALEMTGTERVFGRADAAARQMLNSVRNLGFYARVGASANLLAAVCVARSSPKAVTVLRPGAEAASLASLPIETLQPEVNEAETLELWGIRTLGELAALSEAAVVARLGEPGRRLYQLAQGTFAHLLIPEEPVFSLTETVEFDTALVNLDSLLFVLGPMLRQLLVRAGLRALALASITLTLGLEGSQEQTRTVMPAVPLYDHAILLKLLQIDLQSHPPSAGILTVDLTAEPGPRAEIQTGLYMPHSPEPARLEVTLARLAAVVGEDCVGQIKLLDTHATESFRVERFSLQKAPRYSTSCSNSTLQKATRSGFALQKLRPPVPIAVQVIDREPRSFRLEGVRYTVQQAGGPWRRSGQWWTQEVWSYEEWDVDVTATPVNAGPPLLCLLRHDLLHRVWHIEGLYD